MYIPFFTVAVCRAFIVLASLFPISAMLNNALNGATLGLGVILALVANGWYLAKCLSLSEAAKTKFMANADDKAEYFKQNGGTSIQFTLVYLLILSALIGGLIFYTEHQVTNPSNVNQVELRIDSVRDGVLVLDESTTLAKALESNPYLKNPKWELFEVEPDRYLVRFSADCDVVKEVVEVQEKEPQDLHEIMEGIESVSIVIDFLISIDGTSFDAYQAHFVINNEPAFTGPSEFAYNLLKALYTKQHFILRALVNIRFPDER